MSNKIAISVNLDEELLEKIDNLIMKKRKKNTNRAFNRSAWISEALEKQLKIEMGISYLYWKKKKE